MPGAIELVTGGRKGQPMISENALSVASARSFAPRDALARMLKDVLRLICTIVRGVAFALESVPKMS